ncbi:MAG TPA: oxygenase MpaB family protein, partial [Myxococcota bacterium]
MHRRPRPLPPHADVAKHIASLDAERDAMQIVSLLAMHEFPWDIVRAHELALFHTYGSRSVSTLLDRTGEFRTRGQKRYDDTRLLIGHIIESAFGGAAVVEDDAGLRALAQMNHIHSFYAIPNDDYRFVLWTFIDFPIQWLKQYGRRAFTPHEERAWFNGWIEIGRRMGITDLPVDKAAFDAFVDAYEQREFVPCEASRNVADATIGVMQAWVPAPLRGSVVSVASCLMRPRLRTALGYPTPLAWLSSSIDAALKVRARFKRVLSFEKHPAALSDAVNRTYPGNHYSIEQLG